MKPAKEFKKLSDSKKEILFSELYTLLSSGLDFSRSFKLLIDSEKDNHNAKLLTYIYTSVIQGEQLYIAMQNSKAFSSIDYGVLRIGEETGKLEKVLCLPISGDYPKDASLFPDNRHLVSLNHESNTMTFFKADLEKGLIIMNGKEMKVDNPNCVIFHKLK